MAGSRVGRLPVQATQCAPLLNTIEIKIIIAFANPPVPTQQRAQCARGTSLRGRSPLPLPLGGASAPLIAEDSRRIKTRERSLESKGRRTLISVLKKKKYLLQIGSFCWNTKERI